MELTLPLEKVKVACFCIDWEFLRAAGDWVAVALIKKIILRICISVGFCLICLG
jgi:hypothetical protein